MVHPNSRAAAVPGVPRRTVLALLGAAVAAVPLL
ncbi:chitosanase, partial [Streptomyces sp. SID5998]|nr:chitosanase [Streptomyces sp. SID5998]